MFWSLFVSCEMCLESNLRIDESREKLEEPLLIYLAKTNGFLSISSWTNQMMSPAAFLLLLMLPHILCVSLSTISPWSARKPQISQAAGWQHRCVDGHRWSAAVLLQCRWLARHGTRGGCAQRNAAVDAGAQLPSARGGREILLRIGQGWFR